MGILVDQICGRDGRIGRGQLRLHDVRPLMKIMIRRQLLRDRHEMRRDALHRRLHAAIEVGGVRDGRHRARERQGAE
jgi:hypothetical protein